MKIANMTPLEAAGSILAWGVVAFIAIMVLFILGFIARTAFIEIKKAGSGKDGRK